MRRRKKIKTDWNKEFAYVIGIMATDGNLANDMRHMSITSKDLEVVLLCKKILKLKNKISKKARGGSKDKKYYFLQFGGKDFFEFLLSIGLTPNKSKTISELEIPKKYFLDFLRGCIDGDGSISISTHPQSKYYQYKLRLCSASLDFLKWILKESRLTFRVKGGSICKPEKSVVFTLTFAKKDTYKILEKMYNKNTKSLTRKRKIAENIMKIGY